MTLYLTCRIYAERQGLNLALLAAMLPAALSTAASSGASPAAQLPDTLQPKVRTCNDRLATRSACRRLWGPLRRIISFRN